MGMVISQRIAEKLRDSDHCVTKEEIEQCFANIERGFLVDTREEHYSDPPTQWFVSETNHGRRLKIIFVFRDGDYFIKSAYSANLKVQKLYAEKSKPLEQ